MVAQTDEKMLERQLAVGVVLSNGSETPKDFGCPTGVDLRKLELASIGSASSRKMAGLQALPEGRNEGRSVAGVSGNGEDAIEAASIDDIGDALREHSDLVRVFVVASHLGHELRRERLEIDSLAAAANRGQELTRRAATQDEVGPRRRFFERLEQGIGRGPQHGGRFADEEEAGLGFVGGHGQGGDDLLANRSDRNIAFGALRLEGAHVGVDVLVDLLARRAFAASRTRRGEAIGRLGEGHGSGVFAAAFGAGKEVRLCDSAAGDRPLQELYDTALTAHFA